MREQGVLTRRSAFSLREAQGEKIRALYVTYYQRWAASRVGVPPVWPTTPRWDGGSYKGRRYDSVWQKAAMFLQTQPVNIAGFIEYCVYYFSPRSRPYPTYLCSTRAVSAFNVRRQRLADYVESDARRELQAANQALGMRLGEFRDMAAEGHPVPDLSSQYRIVLEDVSTQLCPLFRYCMANSLGLHDLADRCLSSALLQYLPSSRVYDKVWQAVIPEILRRHESALLGDFGGVLA